MNARDASKNRKVYKAPSIATLGAVEAKTAGPKSASLDGAIGFQSEHPQGTALAEVRIPARPQK